MSEKRLREFRERRRQLKICELSKRKYKKMDRIENQMFVAVLQEKVDELNDLRTMADYERPLSTDSRPPQRFKFNFSQLFALIP